MAGRSATAATGGALPPAGIPVWDLFVRVFHWSLVLAFTTAYLTGDEIESLHLAAGYAVAALVAARILWGFAGTRTARFASFVRGPAAVRDYLLQTLALRAPRHLGHNPAGGAMVVTMLATLAMLCATGWLMTTDAYWGSEWVEGVHETLATLMVMLIALHLAGVAIASLEHSENLVKAMWTGRRRPGRPEDYIAGDNLKS